MSDTNSNNESRRSKYQKYEKATVHRSELKGAPYNPRKINKVQAKRLKNGIKSHGLVGGILWNRRTGNLVGGHQRLTQLDDLEGSQDYTLDVDVIDVDEAEEKELNILLNNPALQGEFDDEKLAYVIEELREENRNVERTGWTMADLQVRLGDGFLADVFAEQRDQEQELFGTMDEIRSVGREAEAEFFGVEPELPADGKERISTTVPTPSMPKDETGAPVGEPGRPAKKDYTEELKRRKEELMVENADKEDADYYVSFVFADNATMHRFLRHFKLQSDKRFFDQFDIEAAFNIDLAE